MTRKTKRGKGHLRVTRALDVPLPEVSGICMRRCRTRGSWLIAVSDRAAKLAWVRLPRKHVASSDWHTIDLARLPGSRLPEKGPQIEAVCADGAGRVLLLQEEPPRGELVDVEASRVVASIELVVRGHGELARSWSDPKGSRGEGAVLLAGGHLLVAKEKKPAALIEFGPKGSPSRGLARGGALRRGSRWPIAKGHHRFVALAVWWPDEALKTVCADFSDLEIGPDGLLYLLSDQSSTIARLEDLPPGGGTVGFTHSWRLKGLDGKPEGLTFAAGGHAVVALDKPKRRNNLLLLEPAIAT